MSSWGHPTIVKGAPIGVCSVAFEVYSRRNGEVCTYGVLPHLDPCVDLRAREIFTGTFDGVCEHFQGVAEGIAGFSTEYCENVSYWFVPVKKIGRG